jgi:4'-phosphopantetheinyl transferase
VPWQRLSTLLSDDELARAGRFRFECNRREYVAAHALARIMLSEMRGGAPRDLTFETGPNGKPYLASGEGPHFNLSHCTGLVTCALSPKFPLGVDIEWIDRPAPLEIAGRHFADRECGWLFGLPEQERSQAFFKIWTMKEAIIKATGMGISQGLETFAVSFDPLGVDFLDPNDAGEWSLRQQSIGKSHVLSLAWRGPSVGIEMRVIDLFALVS